MPFRRRRGIFGGTAALVNEWGIGVTGDVMFPAETALKQGRRPEQRSMDQAVVEDHVGKLTRDVPFSSPSSAGAVALGRSCNERTEWTWTGGTCATWENRGVTT